MADRSSHLFSQVPAANIQRSTFNRSHTHKTTFNAGYLVPIYVDEALPGDSFNMRMTGFCRLATPIFPIMDNLYMDTHFFAVPIRLVWDHWQQFNGERTNPDDTTDYVIPTADPGVSGYAFGSLQDYMGIPPGVSSLAHNNLFCRAYNLVYNEWFRDQNLQDSVIVDLGDGPDNPANYVLLRRGKRHDYFTSCLPWPQKGPAVQLPLGLDAPVVSTGDEIYLRSHANPILDSTMDIGPTSELRVSGSLPTSTTAEFGSQTGLEADLSSATAATINELRQAFQVQRMYERDARGGTRYTEIIRSHFGVVSPDARLQRPEYLGGGSSMINIHPVPQTSESDPSGTPLAQLAGFGTVSLLNHGFTKSFTEHCIIIGLVSVRADYTYQQGLERMFSRSTRFDFYWPALSHLGEQAVLNKEIFATGSSSDADVFGYQERFAEYRYKPSRISGEFRSSFPQSLDGWHLAQDFSTLPLLNDEFIVEDPPMARVKAVTSEPDFIGDFHFNFKCARPMPIYGVPGLIDHF